MSAMDVTNIQPDFTKGDGLIPAIVQDAFSKNVLMLGYMNEEAYQKTLAEKRITFYSRSKSRLWTKGETSGHFLELVDLSIDCDNDTLLLQANPLGPTCHLNNDTCFGTYPNESADLSFLEKTIQHRIANPKEGSYTNSLINKGINKVAQKVGEEAVELVIEAKDDDKDLFLNEAADLMYHYLVLLGAKGFKLDDVIGVLKERHK